MPTPQRSDRATSSAEQTLRVGGMRLHVRETGAGRPLLLLNGVGAHVGMWRPLESATTPGWGGVSGSLRTIARMSTPLRYYSRPYYERTIGDLAGGRARTDPDWLKRHGDERQEHPPHPVGYMWQVAALTMPPGSLPWLHTLAHPTLVVAGDDDPILPLVNSLLLAQRIPRARLLRASGEGHLLLLDPDSAAHPVIRDFVRCDDPRASEAFKRTVEVDETAVREALRKDGKRLGHPVGVLNALTRALYDHGRVPSRPVARGW